MGGGMFINREVELAQLEQLYRGQAAQLFILYGRRRVGKTELLRFFCADKPHIFFVATLSADASQLAAFSQEIWRFLHGEVVEGFTFPTWEAAFNALATLPGRPVVVLDEITYLFEGNKSIPSILQKVWDERLRDSGIFLALCGSYMGIIEREILNYRAPLYGRRTGANYLRPLHLPATAPFFPGYTAIEQIEAWAVLGGMPYYLRIFSDQQDIFANIHQHILSGQGTLHNEPQLLLMEELRDPRNYFSILRAIAQGRTRLNEIAQAVGEKDGRGVTRYLDILRQMRVVERDVPVTERQPEKSRRGIYQLRDAFLRFWFRFVHPNQGSLGMGLSAGVLEQRVRPDFDHFVAHAFEDASLEYVARLAQNGELPFLPERIGRWWIADEEIDVVAISNTERSLLVGECKWTARPVGVNILDDLRRKTRRLMANDEWSQVTYALFAKSGFTPALQEIAAAEGILLVEAEQMVRF